MCELCCLLLPILSWERPGQCQGPKQLGASALRTAPWLLVLWGTPLPVSLGTAPASLLHQNSSREHEGSGEAASMAVLGKDLPVSSQHHSSSDQPVVHGPHLHSSTRSPNPQDICRVVVGDTADSLGLLRCGWWQGILPQCPAVNTLPASLLGREQRPDGCCATPPCSRVHPVWAAQPGRADTSWPRQNPRQAAVLANEPL